MVYLPSGSLRVHRVHAPFVTEKEIAAVVEFWKQQGAAQYDEKFLAAPKEEKAAGESVEAPPEVFFSTIEISESALQSA